MLIIETGFGNFRTWTILYYFFFFLEVFCCILNRNAKTVTYLTSVQDTVRSYSSMLNVRLLSEWLTSQNLWHCWCGSISIRTFRSIQDYYHAPPFRNLLPYWVWTWTSHSENTDQTTNFFHRLRTEDTTGTWTSSQLLKKMYLLHARLRDPLVAYCVV